MFKGDTIDYSFKIYKSGTSPKEYIDGSIYTEVEVQFNPDYAFESIKKLLSEDEVTWDSTNSCFVVPLSQEDTFNLPSGEVEVQVRLFVNDTCKATVKNTLTINEALSRKELE